MRHVKSYGLRSAGNAAMGNQVGIAQPGLKRRQNQVAILHVQDATKLCAEVKLVTALFHFKIRRVSHSGHVQPFQIARKFPARRDYSTQSLENTQISPG